MQVLVAGATGRTGGPLVRQLLERGHTVRAIARSPEKIPASLRAHPLLRVIEASVLDLNAEEMASHVRGCDALVSCLGHVMSVRGMFGAPRDLCTQATRRLCRAIEAQGASGPTKFILMSTVGVPNPNLDERRPWFERALLTLLRHLVPPHRDNETAADFLLEDVGADHPHVAWCAVRPDSLVEGQVSPYDVVPSPTAGLFSGRPTTRANVAHLMADLIEDEDLWQRWRYQMPVIMNRP